MKRIHPATTFALCLTLAITVAAGCRSRDADGGAPDLGRPPDEVVEHPEPVRAFDLLFVLDNSSPSMTPKQAALRSQFPALLARLEQAAAAGHPASYHIGVVTTDFGAGPFKFGNCRPGGDGARLVAAPLPGAAAPAACANLAFAGGARYIDYNLIANTNNVQGGVPVATALACMSYVGESGCAMPSPLEASYRALHDQIPENTGFERPEAPLIVIYLSDGDDCSVAPTGDLFDEPTRYYGARDRTRCTLYGTSCTTPPRPLGAGDVGAPFVGCQPLAEADGGKLISTDRYLNYFTKPRSMGGSKISPADVTLAAITGPRDPVQLKLTTPCAGDASLASCPILNPSCVNPTNLALSAQPAVRLATVVDRARNRLLSSACDTDYSSAVEGVGNLILSRLP